MYSSPGFALKLLLKFKDRPQTDYGRTQCMDGDKICQDERNTKTQTEHNTYI